MCDDIYDNEAKAVPPKKIGRRRTGTAYRRKMKVKHREQVRKNTVYSHCGYLYRSKAAYVDWVFDGDDWYPSGKYVKYPKNSKG